MRFALYIFLTLFSVVLFGLTAARLHYTTHLPSGDPLNNGFDFFDPSIAELCATSILLTFISPLFALTIRRKYEQRRVTRLWFEIVVLLILWLMLLVGSAIATSIWPDLSFCEQFEACRLLQTIVAFAWITWVIISALLFSSIVFAMRHRAWNEHIHQFTWRTRIDMDEVAWRK